MTALPILGGAFRRGDDACAENLQIRLLGESYFQVGRFPIRQEQSRGVGVSLSISGKTKSTAGCYDSGENRVLLACEGCFCILAGWLKLLLDDEHGLRWPS